MLWRCFLLCSVLRSSLWELQGLFTSWILQNKVKLSVSVSLCWPVWSRYITDSDSAETQHTVLKASHCKPAISSNTTSPDSINKRGDFKSYWVKTNFINSVKLCLWFILHYLDLLVNSANVLHELLSVFE